MPLELFSISKSFGSPPTPVLQDISFNVKDGEFIAITGRSGSGKSTLLYILSTLDQPTSGLLKIDQIPVHQLSIETLHRFRNEKMGFIFQFHYLLPELTALENVLMPSLKHGQQKLRKGRALDLLKLVGLEDKTHRTPNKLSGGEQQRVAIARSLIMEPRYLFADEPTGNLDSSNGEAVMNILESTCNTQGTTVLMVTHDREFANRANRIIHLVDGKICD